MSLYTDLSRQDDEEELSDDEVFTRGGKSIPIEENGVNKPLMAPRHRVRDNLQTKIRKVPTWRMIWPPLFYIVITLCAVISIICLVIFVINTFTRNFSHDKLLTRPIKRKIWQPCTEITTRDVWVKSFPMLTTETAVRLNDVNSDGVKDFILGFGTGADAFYYPPVVCRIYFPKAHEGCGGGMMALDGRNGHELWRHYAAHEIFAINCNQDLNEDGINDCLGGGRMATLSAVNGKDGTLLWEFDDQKAKIDSSNVYTPQFIKDVDFDGIPDLLLIHGGDPMKEPGSETRLIGRLIIASGKTGRVLRWVQVPDQKESYYSPQVITHPDGTSLVLFGTGGETHGGSLWLIKLQHLLSGQMHLARKLYSDNHKGVMTPPVVVDITKDGIPDVVMAMFNSSVVAFDGATFNHIWSYDQPSSESYSTPGVGYFNNDTIPDFMINYQMGPGFPIYYYAQATILDGQTGQPLLPKCVRTVVGTQSSPLVVSVSGSGNDIFLYWISDCHGSHSESGEQFDFMKGTSVHDQSRADFCKLRFKDKLFSRMYALSAHSQPPGTVIYDSDLRKGTEYSNPINYSALGLEFLYRHPEYQSEYEKYMEDESVDRKYPYEKVLGSAPEWYNAIPAKVLSHQHDAQNRYPPYDDRLPPDRRNTLYFPYEYEPDREWEKRSTTHVRQRRKVDPRKMPKYKFPEKILGQKYLRKEYGKAVRWKRHVGPHDGGGVQRVISTGTLAPSSSKDGSGIDVVYATFWFYPSDVQALLPNDKQCIQSRMAREKERFQVMSEYYGLDHDAYEEMVTEECLKENGHLKKDNSHKTYNPFNRPMGQMTVYRTHVDCACSKSNKTLAAQCAKILPFDEQMWTSYMGLSGNCIARERKFS